MYSGTGRSNRGGNVLEATGHTLFQHVAATVYGLHISLMDHIEKLGCAQKNGFCRPWLTRSLVPFVFDQALYATNVPKPIAPLEVVVVFRFGAGL